MKIGLITPNNLWFCPYVSIYTKILDRLNINYDIISWNRDGREKLPLQYNKPLKTHNRIYVLYAYMRYATHVKQILKKSSYDRLIVFTPQIGIFLATYLRSAYKNKYIFDYRDLSIEQSVCFKLFLTYYCIIVFVIVFHRLVLKNICLHSSIIFYRIILM